MRLYADQLSTLIPFTEFADEYTDDLVYNAYEALLAYEGTLSVDYEDYVIFFVDYSENDGAVFAISRIIDTWQPMKINDRVRKFTRNRVFPYDSNGHLEFD